MSHVPLISLPDAAIRKGCPRSMCTATSQLRSANFMTNFDGPIAQAGQSRRLITGRSQVRILVGPLLLAKRNDACE